MRFLLLALAVSACSSRTTNTPAPQSAATDPVEKTQEAQFIQAQSFPSKRPFPRIKRVLTQGERPRLIRIESDFNADGRVDFVQSYDSSGSWVQKEEADLDGDGRMDVSYIYTKEGKNSPHIRQQQFDPFYVGRPTLWKDYSASGQLVQRSVDLNQDGAADYFEYYKDNKLVRTERN